MKRSSFLFVVLLGGCAHQPAPIPEYPGTACLRGIADAPEVQAIAGKLSFRSYATIEMTAINERATTDAERKAVSAAASRYEGCISSGAAWRRQYMAPAVEAVGMRYVRNVEADLGVLYQGQITFGQYNAHVNALRSDLEQRINEIRAAQVERQDEFRRQQTIARIMAPPPPVLEFKPVPFTPMRVPLPVTTNCQTINGMTHCTTQ